MSDLIQNALALHKASQSSSWLKEHRQQAAAPWRDSVLPTRKTENWKYTSLQPLLAENFLQWPEPSGSTIEQSAVEIPGIDACRLVFVNGYFQESLSTSELPDGLSLVRFSEASEKTAETISALMGSIVDPSSHQFALLNDCLLSEGVYVKVDKNTTIKRPVHIVNYTTGQPSAFTVQFRTLIHLEEGAEATVIEHFASEGKAHDVFTNSITELQIDNNARLSHYRFQLEHESALHIGGVHANMQKDANLNSFHLGLGGQLKRLDIVINHCAEGTYCQLDGVYLPRNQQHIDYHTCIEHKKPHGITRETFRGIVADQAKAVFNGRIHIHPYAQKVSAELSNKNLLTSRQAEVDTKPELEIYADDVQCAHGATVAQLDEKLLYYMQARGIDKTCAEMMLSFGFINELIEGLSLEQLSDYLRPIVEQQFFANLAEKSS